MKQVKKFVLPYNLQFFADGDAGTGTEGADGNATSSVDGLNSLLDSMDTATNTATTGDSSTAATGDGGTGTDENQPPDQTQQKQTQTKPNKEEFAFAEMRTQNAQLLGLLNKLAKANGIEFKDNKELLANLNDDAINKLADKQKVPPELLKRLEQLEGIEQVHQAQQLQDAAVQGFTALKTEQGLTDDELRSFAAELDAQGKNPFMMQIDIMDEYRKTHWNDILKKETAKAVEEALKKSSAADKHSSTPGDATGKPDAGNPAKINTVSGLNDLLKDMK